MYGSVIYEDAAIMNNALGEHGKIRDLVLNFIYELGLHNNNNSNGCPIRVVFDLEKKDIEELKEYCEGGSYWEFPPLKERNKICKNMLRYNTNDWED